jgi:hypothetical protein
MPAPSGIVLALLLHMRYHEGRKGSAPAVPGHPMTKKRSIWLCALAALLLLPLLANGQESEKTKKKGELTEVETPEERREGLDEELDSKLSEFDALILKEQEILEKRREAEGAAGRGGGAGTAEAGGGEGEGGEEPAEEAEEAVEAEEGTESGAEGTGNSPDEPSGEPIDAETTPPEAGSEPPTGEISNGRIPPDVGDGADDDIVARQLREAAMKEEDPELREKLWDEYRAYKFGEKKKETGG